jgi:hypothetical protein
MDNAEALRALELLADMAHMEDEEYAKAGGGGRVESLQAIIRAHLTDPGYVRVPVEPTAEMIRKGQGQWSGESMVEIYKAMLAAATGESHDGQ